MFIESKKQSGKCRACAEGMQTLKSGEIITCSVCSGSGKKKEQANEDAPPAATDSREFLAEKS